VKTLFITMGNETWASSRYRCYWPAQHMQNTDVMQWKQGEAIPDDYDVYIWQKMADLAIVDKIWQDGKQQFWDLCDPVHWWQPEQARYIADRCKEVVCSSQALADDFGDWYGARVSCIPDRFDLSHYTGGRVEHEHADPVRFIWYGIANNRIALLSALANLERLSANGINMALTICDDRPDYLITWTEAFPIYYTRWSLQTEIKTIAAHDIAILPDYPGPWGRVKSGNKRTTALLCGIPWHDGQDYADLYELAVSAQLRTDRTNDGLERAMQNGSCNVRFSASEWEALINESGK